LATALSKETLIELNDNFKFKYESIEILDQPHMEYDGFRVTLKMTYETLTDKVQIDIGIGDVVNPEEMDYQTFDYKGVALFSDLISIQVYPLETILAEKLETIVSKGSINSRMKDYHDALLIIRSNDLPKGPALKKVIEPTFKNRGTALIFPLVFSKEQLDGLQTYWTAHLRKLSPQADGLNLPKNIADLIHEINTFMF
jgi:hypothetical protein